MSKCPNCKSPMYVHKCMECLHSETPPVKKGVKPCEWPCTATIHVQESTTGRPIQGVYTQLDGAPADTDANGFRVVDGLAPGDHSAVISLSGLQDRYARPIGQDASGVSKAIAASENQFYTFMLDPLTPLKVVVKRRHDSNGVANAKVTLTAGKAGNTVATPEQTTPAGGEVTFARLRQDTYKIAVELDDPGKTKFELEKTEDSHVLDMSKNPDEHILWARLVIHLKLKYKDPDDTVRHFPKDFLVTVVFDDGKTKDLKVLDDAGYFKFEVEDAAKTKFTLKFDSTTTRYLVHEEGKASAELKADPADTDLFTLSDAGKQFFALPKTWSLPQSAWDATDVVVPADGQILIPGDGIGTSTTPAVLTLAPKLQYLRFEFFDRKYRAEADSAKKAVSIPPVVLKGVRTSAADATPVTPVAGSHDTISNWTVDEDDADNACQCLPWIITKTTAGVDLPKLNNKLLFEFGRENAFVFSASATDRKIVVLPVDDAKRKPNRDRDQYYDLPKLWKSKNYFTRFSDASKNKFFDELADADDADLEASYAKAGKLTFSLDDVVLLDDASQAVKDRSATADVSAAGTLALSKYSRITVLTLDPKDKKYKVVVYKPRAEAVYWSESLFQKETGASTVHRNVITDNPINPRVVVFADDFYDIYDKRTASATFADKEILGARAAKKQDTDISSQRIVFSSSGDVDKDYVHLTRKFRLHYLHYAATDGTTVYGAMVTMWTCRFDKDTAKGGTDEIIKIYREEGTKRAMERWNEKDYYFEEDDDKHEVVVKHFCLFEAKDVETSAGVFAEKRGGKQVTMVTLKDDSNGGSSANDTTMTMRRSGALDEGDSAGVGQRANGNGWGNDRWPEHPPPLPKFAPNSQPLTPVAEYDAGNAKPANAFAHELGHAAIGIWDDYVTGKYTYDGTAAKVWEYNNNNASMDREGQRYFGMPFELDKGAAMKNNRSVRLRYFWGRANWLNDMAKAGLQKFLSDKRFRLAYEPTSGAAKLKFSKPDEAAYRSIYKAVKTTKPAASYSLGNNGQCDLHLYHLGEDEFAKQLNGGPYNGILVCCLKLSARFVAPVAWAAGTAYKAGQVVTQAGSTYRCTADHTPVGIPAPDGSMTLPPWDASQWEVRTALNFKKDKIDHVVDLNTRIMTMLQDKFKLQGNGRFSTTYLRIFPQWEIVEPGTAATPGTHFELEFTWGTDTFTPAGNRVVAGTKCKPKSIVRYLFGKIGDAEGQWPAQGGVDGDLTKDDLPRIKAWMDANATGRFNVGDI